MGSSVCNSCEYSLLEEAEVHVWRRRRWQAKTRFEGRSSACVFGWSSLILIFQGSGLWSDEIWEPWCRVRDETLLPRFAELPNTWKGAAQFMLVQCWLLIGDVWNLESRCTEMVPNNFALSTPQTGRKTSPPVFSFITLSPVLQRK
jgi:hypothetical protein